MKMAESGEHFEGRCLVSVSLWKWIDAKSFQSFQPYLARWRLGSNLLLLSLIIGQGPICAETLVSLSSNRWIFPSCRDVQTSTEDDLWFHLFFFFFKHSSTMLKNWNEKDWRSDNPKVISQWGLHTILRKMTFFQQGQPELTSFFSPSGYNEERCLCGRKWYIQLLFSLFRGVVRSSIPVEPYYVNEWKADLEVFLNGANSDPATPWIL